VFRFDAEADAEALSVVPSDGAQDFADVLSKLFPEGGAGTDDGQNVDHRLAVNCAAVAHVFEALGTVVSTHSRGTDTAKGQVLLHVVQRNVVDTGTPTGHVIE